MAVDARWIGLDEALAKMRGLTPKLKKAGFRRAGTKAMAVVRDTARATAKRFDDPESASNISKKIVVQGGSDRSARQYGNDVILTKVGVQGGARPRKGRADEGHWRFLEFGLEFGTKDMAAQPFMRPALEQNVSKVITIYSSSLSKSIDDAIKSDLKSAARRAAKLAGA